MVFDGEVRSTFTLRHPIILVETLRVTILSSSILLEINRMFARRIVGRGSLPGGAPLLSPPWPPPTFSRE